MQTPKSTTDQHIFTVSELSLNAKNLLEERFPMLRLEGEISNLSQPSSGHMYLTLKDQNAQIRAAFFKSKASRIRFKPSNGMQVLIRARLSLYTPRGDFQLIIEHMEKAGIGALQHKFEQLQQALLSEGLFDHTLKQTLPTLPKQIGAITSPTGAAIQDILSVLKRRFPAIPVLIYPVAVQGGQAANAIAKTIVIANQRQECDVLLLARGGGSLEDLWAFNEEVVARAIFNSQLPIITGIGHEIDTSIADFVADYRAPTPSAAAEYISPDQQEWFSLLNDTQQQLRQRIQQRFTLNHQRLQHIHKRLPNTQKHIEQHTQRIDELHHRLNQAIQAPLQRLKQWHAHLHTRLLLLHPKQRLARYHQQLNTHQQRLITIMQYDRVQQQQFHTQLQKRLDAQSPLHTLPQQQQRVRAYTQHLQRLISSISWNKQQSLSVVTSRLDAISPLATLQRGYAIVSNESNDIIRNATASRCKGQYSVS